MRSLLRASSLLCLLALVMVMPSLAASYDWTGTNSQYWITGANPVDPGNWNPNGVAGTADTVWINTEGTTIPNPIIDGNAGTIVGVHVGSSGSTEAGAATLTITPNGSLATTGEIWVAVYQDTINPSSVSTLNLAGSLSFTSTTGGNFHVGWNGGNGQVLMTGTSNVTQGNNTLFVGCAGSGSTGLFSMTDNATYNSTDNTPYTGCDIRFGDAWGVTGGCSGTLSMSGSAVFNHNGINPGWGGYVYNTFGNGNGSGGAGVSGYLNMSGNAQFLTSLGSFNTTVCGEQGAHGGITIANNAVFQTSNLEVGNSLGTGNVNTTGNAVVTLHSSPSWTSVFGGNGWYPWEGTLDVGRTGGSGTVNFGGYTVVDIVGRTNVGEGTTNGTNVTSNGLLTLSGHAVMTTHPGTMRNYGWVWTDGGDLWVGVNEWDNDVNPTIQSTWGGSGTVVVGDYAKLDISGGLDAGFHGGTGSITLMGNSYTIVRGGWAALTIGAAGTGTTLSDGVTVVPDNGRATITIQDNAVLYAPNASVFLGRYGAQGIWNQAGGLATVSYFDMGEYNWGGVNTSTTAINLTGGVLATNYINMTYANGGGSCTSIITFDGGTVRALSDTTDYFRANLADPTSVYVQINSGGGTFDTGGFNVGLTVPLVAGTTPGGGLTKMGSGDLTLADSNTYTGDTNIKAGRLFVQPGTPFVGAAANQINVAAGAALGSKVTSASSTAVAPQTNVSFAANSMFAPTLSDDQSSLSDLQINNLALPARIVVDVQGPHTITSGSFVPYAGQAVLEAFGTYPTSGVTAVTRFASVGTVDVKATYDNAGAIRLDTTDATNRTYVGFSGHETWTYNDGENTNWVDPSFALIPYPNGVNDVAWFNASSGAAQGNFVTLDTSVKLNSMLFNAPSDRAITPGYSILKDVAGDTITLSCAGSTLSSETCIQVLSGTHTIAPDIIMDSTPTIFLGGGSQLTITGALKQSGTVGLDVVGSGGVLSLSSTASNYTGPLAVQSAYVNTSYLTPGNITLRDSLLDYTGTGSPTLTQTVLGEGASVGFGCQQAGAALTVPMNTGNISLQVPTLVVGEAGDLGTVNFTGLTPPIVAAPVLPGTVIVAGSNAVFTPVATSGLALTLTGTMVVTGGTATITSSASGQTITAATNLNVLGGTATFTAAVPTNFVISSQLGAGWDGGPGTGMGSGTGTILIPDPNGYITLTMGDHILIGRDVASAMGTFIAGTPGSAYGPTIITRDLFDVGSTGYGSATLYGATSLTCGHPMAGDSGSGTITMRDTSKMSSLIWEVNGSWAAGVPMSKFIMGSPGSTESPSVYDDGWFNIGSWQRQGELDMYGNSSMVVQNNPNANHGWHAIGAQGIGIVNLADNASLTIHGSDYWMGIMMGADQWDTLHNGGTITMSGNSRFVFDETGNGNANICMAEEWYGGAGGGNTGLIALKDNSYFYTSDIYMAEGQADTSAAITITDHAHMDLNRINASDWDNGGIATITVSGHGSLTAADYLAIGNGQFTHSTLTLSGNAYVTAANWLAVSNAMNGTGYISVGGNAYLYTGDLQIGWGGTGTVVVGDGTGNAVLNAPLCEIGCEYTSPATVVAVLQVNAGGTVQSSQVQSSNYGGVGISSTLYMNGGTLQATADNPTWIQTGGGANTLNVLIQNGGMTVDTNNHNVGIGLPLAPDTGSTGGLTKIGSGVLTLSGNNTYAGKTTIKAGTLVLASSGAQNPVLTGGGADVQNGWTKLVFNAVSGDPASTVVPLLAASYNNGAWNVGQIRSSTAAAQHTSLGYYDNTTASPVTITGPTGTNVFPANAVTVVSTLAGDVNLDGSTNLNDLGIVLANYNTTGDTWATGDLNYDGKTNLNDLGIVLANYNGSLPSLSPTMLADLDLAGLDLVQSFGLAAHAKALQHGGPVMPSDAGPMSLSGGGPGVVPEPGTLALLAAGLLGLLAYAWRRRN